MPHVQLEGRCDLRSFWERFQGGTHREGDTVLKAGAAYLSRDAARILIDCTVVEGFLRQAFLVEVHVRERGAAVRLFHASQPEKSEGVRLCLAWIARLLAQENRSLRWEGDNLGLPGGPLEPPR